MGTYTPNLDFYKPVAHESNYEDTLNPNWDTLDTLLGSGAVNVRDPRFAGGAKGDGVTDDTDAINAAIAATRFYAIGAGFGGATMPAALQGSAGGVVFFPPGVYCISDTIAPDQRGGTDGPGYSANKAISFVGSGYSSTRLKWIGASTTDPMLELGGDGAGNASNNSDQEGAVVRGLRFDGNAVAAIGLRLIECSNMLVDHNAFGGFKSHAILSEPDPLSGHDYGSIDLTIQNNFIGWRGVIGTAGADVGIGIKCVDAHALTVEMNEFSACRHTNLRIQGGGGNNHRIINNSFEGVGSEAGTDAGAPYHSFYLDTSQGSIIMGNAWEDSLSQAVTPNSRALYIAGGGDVTVICNTFYCGGNYVIELASGLSSYCGLQLIGNQSYAYPTTKTVKIPTDASQLYIGLFALGNTNFTFEDPSERMMVGPMQNHMGFGPKAYIGPVTYDHQVPRATLEVNGQAFTAGVSTKVKAGPPVDGDFTYLENGMLAVDSTNNRIYARVGGVWKYAALT